VPYILENAGIAKLGVVLMAKAVMTATSKALFKKRNESLCIPFLLVHAGNSDERRVDYHCRRLLMGRKY
jgi:hypothetical protein